jgi:hypothetical protein
MANQTWPRPDSDKPRAPIRAACHICGLPLDLETCKVDENGKPVHEACYVSSFVSNFPAS